MQILRAGNEDETVKLTAIEGAQEHLHQARYQQVHYNYRREMAKDHDTINVDGVECTFSVLSFDFAEQVSYPSRARTVGPKFFKCAWKLACLVYMTSRLAYKQTTSLTKVIR